jgi:hypothetical protein
MHTLWQRLVSRHKRIKADLAQVELELAKDPWSRRHPRLPKFPRKPYKLSTVILFSVFAFFVYIAALGSLIELMFPVQR